MAVTNLIADPRPYTPVMAAPGFGKRSAPRQLPRRRDCFAHLREREAYIASLIDRMPDGSAIDHKTLAKAQPRYGQQAVRSALNQLSDAGHLRRFREDAGEGERTLWVTRTYFSRTARDNAWWDCSLTGGTPEEEQEGEEHADQEDEPPQPCPLPRSAIPRRRTAPALPPVGTRPARSAAFEALASLGAADPAMALSAAECAELEGLAAEWLARGAGRQQFVLALTSGLPQQVHSPGALARRRLIDKMPLEPVTTEPVRRIMECTGCGVPGRPGALPGGLCPTCRGDLPPRAPQPPTPPHDVHTRVELLRAAARAAKRSRT